MGLYWEAIRLNICRRCIDGDSAGRCRLPSTDECALAEFFPEIVRTVTTIDSEIFDEHLCALRAEICSQCPAQLPSGFCSKRKTFSCALDRYFPSVVQAISTVKQSVRRAV